MQLDHVGALTARVAAEHRGGYSIISSTGARPAVIDGKLRHRAASRLDLPVVGDWVACDHVGDRAIIRAVLPRRTLVVRKAAGSGTVAQPIAANIDTLFVVCGLDGDFNERRIERYVTLAWNSGAQPVVILNKADLCDDVDARVATIEANAWGVPVHAMSSTHARGIEQLEPYLGPEATVAVVGSSGVGKSTLVNLLLGGVHQPTGEVRAADDRGRHTTTARTLLTLPGGAALIDTPGMRELSLWLDEDGLSGAFADIDELARSCRFADCTHTVEPSCAVRDSIDEDRLASCHKLLREQARIERTVDTDASVANHERWKRIHREARIHTAFKRRSGG